MFACALFSCWIHRLCLSVKQQVFSLIVFLLLALVLVRTLTGAPNPEPSLTGALDLMLALVLAIHEP